tara:strand:- start:391 stop:615 length:225 start_codon:yes stop_codon:yes gene_type:complete
MSKVNQLKVRRTFQQKNNDTGELETKNRWLVIGRTVKTDKGFNIHVDFAPRVETNGEIETLYVFDNKGESNEQS